MRVVDPALRQEFHRRRESSLSDQEAENKEKNPKKLQLNLKNYSHRPRRRTQQTHHTGGARLDTYIPTKDDDNDPPTKIIIFFLPTSSIIPLLPSSSHYFKLQLLRAACCSSETMSPRLQRNHISLWLHDQSNLHSRPSNRLQRND